MAAIKNVLWWLLANSLGGVNRGRILAEILTTPHNANELSKILGLDYKTTRYHLQVLEENGLITSAGSGYGKTYFPAPTLEENRAYFLEIWDKIGKKAD